jgi:hypothetical protein
MMIGHGGMVLGGRDVEGLGAYIRREGGIGGAGEGPLTHKD